MLGIEPGHDRVVIRERLGRKYRDERRTHASCRQPVQVGSGVTVEVVEAEAVDRHEHDGGTHIALPRRRAPAGERCAEDDGGDPIHRERRASSADIRCVPGYGACSPFTAIQRTRLKASKSAASTTL